MPYIMGMETYKTKGENMEYRNGKMRVVIKRIYAYWYHGKTGSSMGKAHMDGRAAAYIKQLIAVGFKKVV